MKIWLDIETRSGADRRAAKKDGDTFTVDGACPGCACDPFVVAQATVPARFNDDTYRAGGRCVKCNDAVGWLFEKVETLFGLEEDEAVLNGRPRVY